MNAFTAIIAFIAVCTLPMCYAVPCLSSPLSVVSGPILLDGHGWNGHGWKGHGWNGHGWNGHGWNGHGLLDGWSSCLSPATNCALSGAYLQGPGILPCEGPVSVEKVVTSPALIKKGC